MTLYPSQPQRKLQFIQEILDRIRCISAAKVFTRMERAKLNTTKHILAKKYTLCSFVMTQILRKSFPSLRNLDILGRKDEITFLQIRLREVTHPPCSWQCSFQNPIVTILFNRYWALFIETDSTSVENGSGQNRVTYCR